MSEEYDPDRKLWRMIDRMDWPQLQRMMRWFQWLGRPPSYEERVSFAQKSLDGEDPPEAA